MLYPQKSYEDWVFLKNLLIYWCEITIRKYEWAEEEAFLLFCELYD